MRGQDQQSGINPACLWLRTLGRRPFIENSAEITSSYSLHKETFCLVFFFLSSQTFCPTFEFIIFKNKHKKTSNILLPFRIVVVCNSFANFLAPLYSFSKHWKSFTFSSLQLAAAPSPLPPFLSALWNINNRMTGCVPVARFSVPQMLDCLYSSALWI